MSDNLLASIVVGILSGGLVAGAGTFLTGRALMRKAVSESSAIDAKTPLEVDNIVVAGAEQAVLLMDRALQSAKTRIDQLEQRETVYLERIVALEAQVGRLEEKANTAERIAGEARQQAAELRGQLQAMVREQTPGK